VVVLAQGHAIRWVIITTHGKRHNVSRIDKRYLPFWNQYPETTRAALEVVHLENLSAERRGPTGRRRNFGHRHLVFTDQALESFAAPGEVPRDDSLTH
jgi:hypothetical protein